MQRREQAANLWSHWTMKAELLNITFYIFFQWCYIKYSIYNPTHNSSHHLHLQDPNHSSTDCQDHGERGGSTGSTVGNDSSWLGADGTIAGSGWSVGWDGNVGGGRWDGGSSRDCGWDVCRHDWDRDVDG